MTNDALPLGNLPPFSGAGIYAIYYCGDLALYAPLSQANAGGKFKRPIYVGKAVPAGGRKGGFKLGSTAARSLYNRLREHAESISEAENLNLEHFWCRVLVVDDLWIPMAEGMLISNFEPLWNQRIDGFGNHDPGAGRYNGLRPRWDVLHPGRSWAVKCKERSESRELIELEVSVALGDPTFPDGASTIDEIIGK